MAMFAPIPMPQNRNIFEGVMEAYENSKKLKQQKEQEASRLDEQQQYHQGMLGLQQQAQDRLRQQFNANQELQPLNLELLKAKIESEKALSKSRGKGTVSDALTTASKTKNQNTIQSIDSVLPLIEQINPSKSPGQIIGKYFSPDRQADYQSKISAISDTLIGALGLPKTNESLHLVEKMVVRGPGESDSAYKKRLENLTKDLKNRRNSSLKSLKSGFSDDAINENEVEGQSPPQGTVWMMRPDNVKVPVHEDNVDQAISKYNYRPVE